MSTSDDRPVTAPSPLLATSMERLASALCDAMCHHELGYQECSAKANRLLASGAVVPAASLADDLCKRLCDLAGEPRLFIPGEVHAVLAAALEDR